MTDRQEAAHKWLNRNYVEWMEVQKLRQRLELSESLLSNGVSRMDRSEVQEDMSRNRQEDRQINASYLRDIVEKRFAALDEADATTIQIIAKLEDADERMILLSRYILRMTWNAIERDLHISTRNLYRKRDKALDHVAEYIA